MLTGKRGNFDWIKRKCWLNEEEVLTERRGKVNKELGMNKWTNMISKLKKFKRRTILSKPYLDNEWKSTMVTEKWGKIELVLWMKQGKGVGKKKRRCNGCESRMSINTRYEVVCMSWRVCEQLVQLMLSIVHLSPCVIFMHFHRNLQQNLCFRCNNSFFFFLLFQFSNLFFHELDMVKTKCWKKKKAIYLQIFS